MHVFFRSLVVFAGTSWAGDTTVEGDIALVLKQDRGTAEGRAAWSRLSQADAGVLPALLEGMNTSDTVAANWLRLAFDQVAERELKAGGKRIDIGKLEAFVKNAAKNGRARRLALDLLDRARPGTSARLVPDWLDDPEFRMEAVALVLEKAERSAQAGELEISTKLFRQALEKSRDIQQGRDAAAGLKAAGVNVSVAEHLGFLMDWRVIGPFDGQGQKGFHIAYPPEKKVDLAEELDGQKGKVRWKRFRVPETFTGRHQALVDLTHKEALGRADDAVAFAYTEFSVEKAMKAEMRGAADDNFTVWVNGAKVFGFEEWRNGVRHDRHRFEVKLNAGKNTVLVKVCQSMAPNPEPNWEFFLRVVDATGKGTAKAH